MLSSSEARHLCCILNLKNVYLSAVAIAATASLAAHAELSDGASRRRLATAAALLVSPPSYLSCAASVIALVLLARVYGGGEARSTLEAFAGVHCVCCGAPHCARALGNAAATLLQPNPANNIDRTARRHLPLDGMTALQVVGVCRCPTLGEGQPQPRCGIHANQNALQVQRDNLRMVLSQFGADDVIWRHRPTRVTAADGDFSHNEGNALEDADPSFLRALMMPSPDTLRHGVASPAAAVWWLGVAEVALVEDMLPHVEPFAIGSDGHADVQSIGLRGYCDPGGESVAGSEEHVQRHSHLSLGDDSGNIYVTAKRIGAPDTAASGVYAASQSESNESPAWDRAASALGIALTKAMRVPLPATALTDALNAVEALVEAARVSPEPERRWALESALRGAGVTPVTMRRFVDASPALAAALIRAGDASLVSSRVASDGVSAEPQTAPPDTLQPHASVDSDATTPYWCELIAAVAAMDPTLHVMEVLNALVADKRVPPDLLRSYVSGAVAHARRIPAGDRLAQKRAVRLLCVFALSLLRGGSPATREALAGGLATELEAFVLEHSAIKEAALLYRALKQGMPPRASH